MLNYIWAGMILLGVIYGVCTGQMSALTGGALDSAREAVSLCITMAGVMALWMGLMEIAQESGTSWCSGKIIRNGCCNRKTCRACFIWTGNFFC